MSNNQIPIPKTRSKETKGTYYSWFSEYSKEEIDQAMEKLPKKDMEILHKRYGEDLENPTLQKVEPKDNEIVGLGFWNKLCCCFCCNKNKPTPEEMKQYTELNEYANELYEVGEKILSDSTSGR